MFAGEIPEPLAVVGVMCRAVGVMALTSDRPNAITKNRRQYVLRWLRTRASLHTPLSTGWGVRQAGSVLGFAASSCWHRALNLRPDDVSIGPCRSR
jgi:hypothetical protein